MDSQIKLINRLTSRSLGRLLRCAPHSLNVRRQMKYSERYKVCLVNPSAAEMELRDPLSTFSFYRQGTLTYFAGSLMKLLST